MLGALPSYQGPRNCVPWGRNAIPPILDARSFPPPKVIHHESAVVVCIHISTQTLCPQLNRLCTFRFRLPLFFHKLHLVHSQQKTKTYVHEPIMSMHQSQQPQPQPQLQYHYPHSDAKQQFTEPGQDSAVEVPGYRPLPPDNGGAALGFFDSFGNCESHFSREGTIWHTSQPTFLPTNFFLVLDTDCCLFFVMSASSRSSSHLL
jgi:hypothetical protein